MTGAAGLGTVTGSTVGVGGGEEGGGRVKAWVEVLLGAPGGALQIEPMVGGAQCPTGTKNDTAWHHCSHVGHSAIACSSCAYN